ncbi:MAG: magnesium transporter [Eubacterium sp.]|nr:magnesium transporter [Eubacterium sp.]
MENITAEKLTTPELEELLRERKLHEARERMSEMMEADLAELLSELDEEHLSIAFRILPKELAADAFSYLESETQQTLIKALSDKELNFLIENLFLDDTVDMIEEMPANVVKRILSNTDPVTRREINELLKYPEDSAGSIMTTEYVRLQEGMTVQQAFDRIRKVGVDKETIYTCYVTNAKRELLGVVTIKDLLLAEYETEIRDIMETNVIYVNTMEDQEKVAHSFDRYDFLSIPVVDKEHRLVGIITFDDVIDVLQEENTEDIERMAAIIPTDKPYIKTSAFETFKKRIPWLLLLMISATFTGGIIAHYEKALGAYVVLTAYIPMLMDTGGNAGSQASVSVIRGISLEEIEFKDIFRIQGKEFFVSLLCGVTLAIANFLKLIFIDQVSVTISLVVCLTLVCTVIVAKFVGCSLPILAKKVGFDPAVMASPFITTIVDALSLLIYFQFASHILGI